MTENFSQTIMAHTNFSRQGSSPFIKISQQDSSSPSSMVLTRMDSLQEEHSALWKTHLPADIQRILEEDDLFFRKIVEETAPLLKDLRYWRQNNFYYIWIFLLVLSEYLLHWQIKSFSISIQTKDNVFKTRRY